MQTIKDWKSRDHFRKHPCVSRLNLVEIWMHSSRILFGMLMPKLYHFAMLCNSHKEVKKVHVCVLHSTHTRHRNER